MASSCPTIADATSRCTASATRWNSSGSSGVGIASASGMAAFSVGVLMDLLTNDLTLAAGIEHTHGIAVVVGHEDAVRALVHRQGIGTTAHGNGAHDPPAVSVEHAHAATAVVGDEDAPAALVHRQGIGAEAHGDGAQALPGSRVKHAHVVVSLVGDEDEAAFLIHRQRKGCEAHGDDAQNGPAAGIEHAHAAATGDAALAGGAGSIGDEDAAGLLVDGDHPWGKVVGAGAHDDPAARVEHAHRAATGVDDEDAVGPLIYCHGDRACAHGHGAQQPTVPGVEHAHATVAIAHAQDESAARLLVHRHRSGTCADGNGAQDRTCAPAMCLGPTRPAGDHPHEHQTRCQHPYHAVSVCHVPAPVFHVLASLADKVTIAWLVAVSLSRR